MVRADFGRIHGSADAITRIRMQASRLRVLEPTPIRLTRIAGASFLSILAYARLAKPLVWPSASSRFAFHFGDVPSLHLFISTRSLRVILIDVPVRLSYYPLLPVAWINSTYGHVLPRYPTSPYHSTRYSPQATDFQFKKYLYNIMNIF